VTRPPHGLRRAQTVREILDLVLLTKVDLLPHLDVDGAAIRDGFARVMPSRG
jgi:hypothetical protein